MNKLGLLLTTLVAVGATAATASADPTSALSATHMSTPAANATAPKTAPVVTGPAAKPMTATPTATAVRPAVAGVRPAGWIPSAGQNSGYFWRPNTPQLVRMTPRQVTIYRDPRWGTAFEGWIRR